MDTQLFKTLCEVYPEGIVIMDDNRKIIFINKMAAQITGWQTGEYVPYCSYCQLRQVSPGEERCILANDHPIPSFTSHMPNYVDSDTEFEMTMKKIETKEQCFKALMIKKPTLQHHDEKIKIQELLIRETMHAQENERKRIAMELHDNIGQSIYSLFLGLDGIKRHVKDPEYHHMLDKLTSVMENTLFCLKRLTKELRPHLFDKLGFETGLRSSVEDWSKIYNVDFTLDIHIPREVTFREEGLYLYRIIQEAVNNAVRHGKADKVDIEIYLIDQELYFQITDNGTGFNIEEISRHGLGIKHMKERVRMFNGDIKWISEKGGPTRVEGYMVIGEVKS